MEKRIEGAVNGVFARAFKGDVQPVEIAARLQRELDAEAKLLSRDRRLVPNEFVVALSTHDHDRLAPYAKTFTGELIPELRSHATAMGYVFNGPILIHLEHDESLPTGRFDVTSQAVAGESVPGEQRPARDHGPIPSIPEDRLARPRLTSPSDETQIRPADQHPPLVLEVNGIRHPLEPPGLVIGRGTDADLRINDPGISRRHAELRVSGRGSAQRVSIVDLGSTNGIMVNGRRVREATLSDGSRIEVGSTRMLVHAPAGR
ncbi:MAG: FhaA domain-containing protein [Propionibacteriaceae bacterium]